ncbi:MAG: outer membrane protein transport protein [Desulfobacter sp.]|nr:MAG: outer membrane protein transport protein [Desulfobacter sp.]
MMALTAALLGVPQAVLAGGVDNKQNLSAAYAGGPSRNGAIEGADIAAYNPAGIMQLKNGLTCALDAQFISTNYDHTTGGRDYGNENYPVVPSLFAIYKKDNWAFYGSFTVPGGGGEVEYKEGNIITRQVSNKLTGVGLGREDLLKNQYAYVESYDYGLTAGASYALSDNFSFSAGIRRVITEKKVDIRGYLGSDIIAKFEQDAQGWGGVFGMNYRPNKAFNLALRYETRVNLDWETKIPGDTNAMGRFLLQQNNREDGHSYARDLPAVLGLGMQWAAAPKLTVSPSFTYYFEKDANWGDQNGKVNHNAYDIAIAFAYAFNEKWTATWGYMYTDTGIDPADYGIIEQMSPPLDCHTLSVGGTYRATERLAFKLGLMGSFYVSDTAPADPASGAPETEYSKTNYTAALSMEYRFF